MADIAKLTFALETTGADRVKREVQDGANAFSKFQASIISTNQAIGLLRTGADLAFGAIRTGFDVINAVTQAGGAQANAISQLEQALRNAGQLTGAYSSELQALASAQQAVTTTGDEVLIGYQAQLVAAGVQRDEMQRTIEAAQDLAFRVGDVGTAVGLLEKAYLGNTTMLSRYGFEVDSTATRSEKFEQVLEQIERRMGGQARAAAETYTGRLTQLSNATGDVTEELGLMIVQSNAVNGTLGVLVDTMSDAAGGLADFRRESDAIEPVLQTVITTLADASLGVVHFGQSWIASTRVLSEHKAALGALLSIVPGGRAFAAALPDPATLDKSAAALGDFATSWEKTVDRIHQRVDFTNEVRSVTDLGAAFRREVSEIEQAQAALKTAGQSTPTLTRSPLVDADGWITPGIDAAKAQDAAMQAAADRTAELTNAVRDNRFEASLLFHEYERRGQDIPADILAIAKAHGIATGAVAGMRPHVEELSRAQTDAATAAEDARAALMDQAAQLTQSLDPFAKYMAEVSHIKELQPFISPEIERRALAEVRGAYEEATDTMKGLRDEAAGIFEATRTPFERLVTQLEKVRDLSSQGLLDPDTTARAVAQARDGFESINSSASDALGNVSELTRTFGQGVGDAFVDMSHTGKFAVKDMLRGIADDLIRFGAGKFITQPLIGGLDSLFDSFGNQGKPRADDAVAQVFGNRRGGLDYPELGTRLAGRGFSDTEIDGLQQTLGTLNVTATEFQGGMRSAVDSTESGFDRMIAGVGSNFGTMIGGIGTAFAGIVGAIFGGGGGGFSVEGLFKAIAVGAIQGGLSSFGAGALAAPIGNVINGQPGPVAPAFNPFPVTGPQPGPVAPAVDPFPSAYFSRQAPAVDPMPWAHGAQYSRQAPDQSQEARGPTHVTNINLPVTIPVTSLDPTQAAAVIMKNMPMIKSEITREMDRGGAMSRAVGRKS